MGAIESRIRIHNNTEYSSTNTYVRDTSGAYDKGPNRCIAPGYFADSGWMTLSRHQSVYSGLVHDSGYVKDPREVASCDWDCHSAANMNDESNQYLEDNLRDVLRRWREEDRKWRDKNQNDRDNMRQTLSRNIEEKKKSLEKLDREISERSNNFMKLSQERASLEETLKKLEAKKAKILKLKLLTETREALEKELQQFKSESETLGDEEEHKIDIEDISRDISHQNIADMERKNMQQQQQVIGALRKPM